jgi:hypothetical protein
MYQQRSFCAPVAAIVDPRFARPVCSVRPHGASNFPFRYRDRLTGKWVEARYVARASRDGSTSLRAGNH